MSERGKVLLFFTGTFPYGRQEAFIENEIQYLSDSFDRVIVLPQHSAGSIRATPSNVQVELLPELKGAAKGFRVAIAALLSRVFWKSLGETAKGKDLLFRLRLLASYVGLAEIYRAHIVKQVLPAISSSADVFFYSYWADRGALAMILAKPFARPVAAVSRVHGFDVYEERSRDGYLPVRKTMFSKLDAVFAISGDAAAYLSDRYPGLCKYLVSRLGTTRSRRIAEKHRDPNVFHVVSVSNVIPLKRVSLIAEALNRFAARTPALEVRWTHFGDGPLFNELKLFVEELRTSNLTIDLRGGQMNSIVKQFYEEVAVDLFLSLSESEGIPVSFMEAMSYGVPVLATLVGGVGEILDDSCAFLVSPDVTADQVAKKLAHIAGDPQCLNEYSVRAIEVWRQRYSAEITYPAFCNALLGKVR